MMPQFLTPTRRAAGSLSGAIRRHYDDMAHIYRLFWGNHIHHGYFQRGDESPAEAQLNLLRLCARMLGLQSGSSELRALDVGCGNGATSTYLASEFGYQVDGITLSPKQRRIAESLAAAAGLSRSQVSFSVEDAEVRRYLAGAYDLVWVMESSEHFSNKSLFLKRAGYSLRARGRFLLAAWTGSMRRTRVRRVAEYFLCPHLISAQDYIDHIEASGMMVTDSVDLTATIVRTWDICLQRARAFEFLLPVAPAEIRRFVDAIHVIRDAYDAGDLTYSVITAHKRDDAGVPQPCRCTPLADVRL